MHSVRLKNTFFLGTMGLFRFSTQPYHCIFPPTVQEEQEECKINLDYEPL